MAPVIVTVAECADVLKLVIYSHGLYGCTSESSFKLHACFMYLHVRLTACVHYYYATAPTIEWPWTYYYQEFLICFLH